jgi:conjugative transfer signal peptidase TraF
MTRFSCIATTSLAVLSFGVTALIPLRPKLVWNASASVPVGLYALQPPGTLHVGELVAAKPPPALAAYMAGRGYLPTGLPLLKHILARPGQTICRHGLSITVDGRAVGAALDRDTRGRTLPDWRGCRRIPRGQVFLMNRGVQDSFDGRYFGLLSTNSVIGRAEPLWTRNPKRAGAKKPNTAARERIQNSRPSPYRH